LATNTTEASASKLIAQLRAYKRFVQVTVDQEVAKHVEEVVALAKTLSPVRTGFNRDHIMAVKESYLKYKAVANSPYAAALELGTEHMAAEPFLFPAYEALRNSIPGKLAAALKKG
jgi:HK97 gp10 family phage protein